MGQSTIPTPDQGDESQTPTSTPGTESTSQGGSPSGEAAPPPPLADRYRSLREHSTQQHHELESERQANAEKDAQIAQLNTQMSQMSQAAVQQPVQAPPQVQAPAWDETFLTPDEKRQVEDSAGDPDTMVRVSALQAQRAAQQQTSAANQQMASAITTMQDTQSLASNLSTQPEFQDASTAQQLNMAAQQILSDNRGMRIALTGFHQVDQARALERALLEHRANKASQLESTRTAAAAEGFVDMGGSGGPMTGNPEDIPNTFEPILHLSGQERFVVQKGMKQIFKTSNPEVAFQKFWNRLSDSEKSRRLKDGAPPDGESRTGARKRVIYTQDS